MTYCEIEVPCEDGMPLRTGRLFIVSVDRAATDYGPRPVKLLVQACTSDADAEDWGHDDCTVCDEARKSVPRVNLMLGMDYQQATWLIEALTNARDNNTARGF